MGNLGIINRYSFNDFDENFFISKLDILWSKDRNTIDYEFDYWNKYIDYEHKEISIKLNKLRCNLVEKYSTSIIDIGIGCGEFIKKIRITAKGYDVNPLAVKWLKDRNLYCDVYNDFPKIDGITLWDVLEHIPNPESLINIIPDNCFVFLSIPIIDDFNKIYNFKHYRPKEHLTYFSRSGIINYFNILGFTLMEFNKDESIAGRESIESFVFKKTFSFKNKLDLSNLKSIRDKQGIYLIKNKKNNKIYVGSAIYNLNKNRITRSLSIRIQDNLRKLKNNCHHNKHLQNSWNKHGIENFEFYVVEFFIGLNEDLLLREQYWIDELKAANTQFGFNICPKAGNSFGRPVTIETRNKISLANKGKKYSLETKQKMSQWQIGKKLSQETKNKISKSEKGKSLSKETKELISKSNTGKVRNIETKKTMMLSSHTKKLSIDDVLEIKKMLEEGVKISIIANKFMVTKSNISAIKNGKTWKYI